jgi:hypothetical protein
MHFNVDSCSLLMCSHEHKTILTAGLFGKLINKPQQMELNLWGAQNAESSARNSSGHSAESAKPNRSVAGATFAAMEMQSLSLHKIFHDGRYLGDCAQIHRCKNSEFRPVL